jgi:hypothetical protein
MKLPQNGIVSFSIRLAVFLASGGALMKPHKIRYHIEKNLTAQERRARRDYLKFSFSAISARLR